ncbi:MAG: 50S ribosomal protein L18 [Planctomycetota bacterium]|nr:50S ribosomal protein L18 [Planctomycetota bacterium]
MDKQVNKDSRRSRRRIGIRKRITGTPQRPRLAVYKSLKHMHAQIIDDLAGKTLCAASSTEEAIVAGGKTGNVPSAALVGQKLAERAKAAGVKAVVFDRGGFKYHGRVKALGDAARKGGLEF